MTHCSEPNTSSNSNSKVGLKTFFNISRLWDLTPDQEATLLGLTNHDRLIELREEKYTGVIAKEMLQRISFVLSIYKQLNTLLPAPDSADKWLSLPNSAPLFNGESALSFLLKDPDNHLPKLLGYLRNVI